jgi:pyruvate,water dikinase
MLPVELHHVTEAGRHGGKAAALGHAVRAGLPVPWGVALCVETTEAITRGVTHSLEALATMLERLEGAPLAVRSSAPAEDGAEASFAGQHESVLGVLHDDVVEAVRCVHASASSPSARAYRERLGITGHAHMAVVIQAMVKADVSGVMFTRNPVSGADERVVEASYGLGEAIVSGLVTPDHFRFERGGQVRERVLGEKDVEITLLDSGKTEERPVLRERIETFCIDDAQLSKLDALANLCDEAFEGAHDLEWAFEGGELHLLQRRPLTR